MDLSAQPANRKFFVPLLAVLAVYAVLASIYAVRLQRNMDEFGMTNIVLDLVTSVPFRDFCPPKTLLGHYLVLPPFLLLSDGWNALTAARFLMVALTTIVLAGASWYLRRW